MRKIFLFLLVSFSLLGFAQEYTAEQLLSNAKNGALLFRLTTNTKKIEALKSAGKAKEALELAEKTKLDQAAWINAFTAEYHYGSVLFFYDYDARKIVDGDLSVVFDKDLKLVNEKDLKFVVAGISETHNFSLIGIVLLTPKMEDVPKKMPRFVSAYGFLHLSKKTFFQMVKELNTAFGKYN